MNVVESITPKIDLKNDFQAMKTAFSENPYTSYEERIAVLKKLKSSLIKYEQTMYDAIKKDYGYRSEFDSLLSELLPTVSSINYTIKKLKKWMKPSKRHAGLMLFPSTVKVHYQPLGVVGIITPWNFPFFLALGPAIQAIAAGNRVMIKMSEFTPHTNQVLRTVIECISEHAILIEGEADVGAAFSELPFDHLIFTGSTAVAKKVAQSAAGNLTPLTLELGGKSPTIIDENINMNIAVDAIIVGKSINSGQICVAPDYIFVPHSRENEFIETFIERYKMYHVDGANKNSQTHIINHKQYDRLMNFLDDAESKGAKIHPVKPLEKDQGKRIYPQLVTQVTHDMTLLKEEIFGSILPIITYQSMDEVIQHINERARPLALYIMSNDSELINRLLKNTHSGGVAINDSAAHVTADDAPFGGIGHSGMGHYHGHEGFFNLLKS